MKKVLRKLLNNWGYDLVKINVHSASKAGKRVSVQVGNYNINMPGNNPQISLYKYYAESNLELGRLAKIIVEKYKDATMIDIGANVGDTIAIVKSQINIPVIAIEGDPVSFAFLKENSTQFSEVELFSQYLGEEKKEVLVTVDKDGWNSTIIPDSNGSKKIDIKTLDDLIIENGLANRPIKLLKVDTEGFDTIILRGSRKTIAKDKPVIYFEYNGENMKAIGEDGLSTLLSLKEYGYKSVHFYDCVNNLILVTTLDNTDLITALDRYANRPKSMVPYYDICVFHDTDQDLSDEFYKLEN